jgi:hypothetical protein
MGVIRRKSYGYLTLMVMISACVVSGVGYAEFPSPDALASSTSSNGTQNTSATIMTPSNASTYENSTFGFRMNYPSKWIMHEAGPNDMHMVVGFLAPGEDMDNPVNYVLVQVETLPGKPTITSDQYAQAVIDNLKKSYSDFNLISAKDIKISGLPGKELSYTMSSGQSNYHNIVALTVKDNKAYTITLDSLSDKYSVFEGSAAEMINSFEFEPTIPSMGSTIGAPLMSH